MRSWQGPGEPAELVQESLAREPARVLDGSFWIPSSRTPLEPLNCLTQGLDPLLVEEYPSPALDHGFQRPASPVGDHRPPACRSSHHRDAALLRAGGHEPARP